MKSKTLKEIYMKRWLCWLATLFLTALVVWSQAPSPAQTRPTEAEQEVLARQQAYCDAIVKGDLTLLDQLLADDFIITAGNGTLRDKQAELADLKPTADFKTLLFKTTDLRVRMYDKTAVLTGRMSWRVANNGREFDNERRFTSVFVKQNGQWRIVAQQVGRVP